MDQPLPVQAQGVVPLIVTRPEPEASNWVSQLRARGVPAQALPLLDTQPARPQAQQQWQQALAKLHTGPDQPQAWMAVSAPAVRFAQAAAGALWQPQTWAAQGIAAWATGPGTRAAWLAADWPAKAVWAPPADAAQFDSEALWAVVQASLRRPSSGDAAAPVWLLRGSDASGQAQGRDWLLQQLHVQGVPVLSWAVYQRSAVPWTAEMQERTQQALSAKALWLFSSSEALVHWHAHFHALGERGARARSDARLLLTHPRMAERAQQLGWPAAHLRVCAPKLDAVVQEWSQGWAQAGTQ